MITQWPLVRVGELLKRSEETIAIKPDVQYPEITVRLWGKGVVRRQVVPGVEIAGARRLVARVGQFILSRIDARNGAFGLVQAELDGAVVSNDFPLFMINEHRLLPAFLEWFSRTGAFVEMCQRASEGTTNRVRLQENTFLNLEVALPPLMDQQRIVVRIEELAAKISEAIRLRREAAEESAASLTATLRTVFSECPGAIVSLEHTCSAIIDNLHSNPRYTASGVACVRSPDVGYGTLNLAHARLTDEDEYRRRTVRAEPQINDIVFVREGGGTGKCALVLKGQRFSLGQRVMMLRPDPAKVLPRFLLYQLLAPQTQEDQIEPLCKGSASLHLNIAALRTFAVRLPALADQATVVAGLDRFQAQLTDLRQLQRESAAELDALMPAILDRAFKGEL